MIYHLSWLSIFTAIIQDVLRFLSLPYPVVRKKYETLASKNLSRNTIILVTGLKKIASINPNFIGYVSQEFRGEIIQHV